MTVHSHQAATTLFQERLFQDQPVVVQISGQPLAVVARAQTMHVERFNRLLHLCHSIFYLLLPRANLEKLQVPEIGYNRLGWIMTETIESTTNIATGISVKDRVETISQASSQDATSTSVMVPGHVYGAILDDGAGYPASVLCRHLGDQLTPLLWMPLLRDDDGAVLDLASPDFKVELPVVSLR